MMAAAAPALYSGAQKLRARHFPGQP